MNLKFAPQIVYVNENMKKLQWRFNNLSILLVLSSDVDPVLAKNKIQGFVPKMKGDFQNSFKWIF